MLKLDNISRVYDTNAGKVNALQGVSFCLPETGMISIVGKSGSGKSTLLNILSGNDMPTDGYLLYNNNIINKNNIDNYRTNTIGMIFQDNKLIKGLNVHENIKIAMEIGGNSLDIDNLLSTVGLEGYGNRLTSELSAGQAQRIAIARAIAKGAKVILADEPTGNLDSETARQIFELLKRLSQNILVVMVTHDQESADKYSDIKIELIDGKVATISQLDTVALKSAPNENANFQIDRKNKKIGSLPILSKISMTKWIYNNIGFKTIMLSLISIFMLILTVISAGLFSTSYEQSLNGKLANNDDFLIVNNNQLFLNNADISILENKLGQPLQKGVTLSNVNTIMLYNPSKSAMENQLLEESLYFFDRMYLNTLVSANSAENVKLLTGRLPSAAWEICLPSIFAESVLEYQCYPIQDKKFIFNPNYSSSDVDEVKCIDDILGKELLFSSNSNYKKFKIVGFFQSATDDYHWLKRVKDINGESEKEKSRIESYSNALTSMRKLGMGIITEDFLQDFIELDKSLDKIVVTQSQYLEYNNESYRISSNYSEEDVQYMEGKSRENSLKYDIIIPKNIASDKGLSLGDNIFLDLSDTFTKQKLSFKIIGFHLDNFILSDIFINELNSSNNYRVFNNFIFTNFKDKNHKVYLNYLTNELKIDTRSISYSTATSYGLSEAMGTFQDFKYFLFLPMILISLVLGIVFISALVSDFTAQKASDIGTLRAMGLRKSEVYKIFLIALGFQLLIEFAIALVVGGLIFMALNALLISTMNLFVNVLFLNTTTVIVTLIAVIAIIPLGILLPIRNKNRKTPQSLMNK